MMNAKARARIRYIREAIPNADKADKRLLQNGVIPEHKRKYVDASIEALAPNESDAPLTLTEYATYGTWFYLHPEKVAGSIEPSSSLFFSFDVKGTREDVDRVLTEGARAYDAHSNDADEIELAAARARARERERKRKKAKYLAQKQKQ